MNTTHDELTHLVKEEPTASGRPDLTAILREGHRLRRRRRLVSGTAALAAAAVIAPAGVMLAQGEPGPGARLAPAEQGPAVTGRSEHGEGEQTRRSPRLRSLESVLEARSGEGSKPAVCGVMACESHDYAREEGTVVGEELAMGAPLGLAEVLYVAQVPGHDLRSGEKLPEVDVLMSGVVEDGELRRTVWALQPGTERLRGPVALYGGDELADADGEGTHYGVIGYLRGEHAEVEATLPDGSTRPVSGSSTESLPGWTVFYDTGSWQESWTDDRAPVAYGLPGGPSCGPSACGSIG